MSLHKDDSITKEEVDGIVRANIETGAIILRSLKDDPNKTQVTIIQKVDFKINAPAFVLNMALLL